MKAIGLNYRNAASKDKRKRTSVRFFYTLIKIKTSCIISCFLSQNLFIENNVIKAFQNTQKIIHKKYDPYYWAGFILIA